MELFSGSNGRPFRDSLHPDSGKRARYEELVQEIIQELYGNALYWEFFKTFSEASVHDFIPDYASRKAWYLLNGPVLLRKKEREQFRFRDLAENCFWEIQQKKLFHLQAEWRAGLAEPVGIKVTRDFFTLERKIRNLPFIPAVTAEEVCLYIDYLKSGSYEEKKWYINWQDYDIFRAAGNELDEVPAWYRYHDRKTGLGYALMLPDKKGEEETECLRLLQKQEGFTTVDPTDAFEGVKPDLSSNYETFEFFIKTFESRNLLSWFRAAEKEPADHDEEIRLQDALRLLSQAETPVKLPDAADWRTAVIQGAMQYKTAHIAAHLPLMYEEYLVRMKSGISFPEPEDDERVREMEAYAMNYREQVEAGRKIRDGER